MSSVFCFFFAPNISISFSVQYLAFTNLCSYIVISLHHLIFSQLSLFRSYFLRLFLILCRHQVPESILLPSYILLFLHVQVLCFKSVLQNYFGTKNYYVPKIFTYQFFFSAKYEHQILHQILVAISPSHTSIMSALDMGIKFSVLSNFLPNLCANFCKDSVMLKVMVKAKYDSWNNIFCYKNSYGEGPCEAVMTSYYAH